MISPTLQDLGDSMFCFKSDFLHIMEERGFIHQVSNKEELDNLFAKERVTAYVGFDPTAPSLHVGNLIQIMMLHWMQQTGHRPIVLIGGGTGMIGDPSFKDEARQLMTKETIAQNIAEIRRVFSRYIHFDGIDNEDSLMVNNADWLCNLNYLEFLRDIGRHFSVNRMLSFDSVKLRLDREHSLSFLEFNYMILQAYDFITLNKYYSVRLQIGGSDQWGNIINGIHLGHHMGTPQLYALTSPLLTTTSGKKMGKSLSGAVWLNANMLSSYEFWQYWRNVEDADIGRFFKLYTILAMDEITRLSELQGTEINEAKKILATEITAMRYGRKAAETAAKVAYKTFEERKFSTGLPTVDIFLFEIKAGIGLQRLLVKVGLAKSNSEARRHIQSGGIRVNDQLIDDERIIIDNAYINGDGLIKLSLGKKKHFLINTVVMS